MVKKNKKDKANEPKNIRLYLILIFVFTFIIYGNSINHDFALDDQIAIISNGYVNKGVAGFGDIFTHGYLAGFIGKNDSYSPYRPLVLASFAIEKQLFDYNPVVNHFFNVLLYAVAGLILFLFLRKLFPKANALLPLIITLLFVAHPVHTEVVANIKSRDEILSFLFGILALSVMMDFIRNKSEKSLVLLILYYLLALLSKENALTLIAVAPLLIYFFSDGKLKQLITVTGLLALCGGVYLLIRFLVLDRSVLPDPINLIDNTLAAATSSSQYYATATFILGKYMLLLLLPIKLTAYYSYNQVSLVNWSDWQAFVPLLIILIMSICTIIYLKNKNLFAFCFLFFVITISMVSNFFLMIGTTLGERFLFMPSLAFCVALPLMLIKVLKIDSKNISLKTSRSFLILSGAVLLFYSFKTIDRNTNWKDNFSLFSTDIIHSPNSAAVHCDLGTEYTFRAEEAINPDDRDWLLNNSIALLKRAIEIYPKFYKAYYNLGRDYFLQEKTDSAMWAFRSTLKYNPNDVAAMDNLALCFMKKENTDSTISVYKQLIKRDTTFLKAFVNLGASYHKKNNFDTAVYYYRKALVLDPQNSTIKNYIDHVDDWKRASGEIQH